jgi:ribonuclease I
MLKRQILAILIITCILTLVFANKKKDKREKSKSDSELDNLRKQHLRDQNDYESYDMYVLSIQWENTICQHPKCHNRTRARNIFTLHGLWPGFTSQKEMRDCNTGDKIDVRIRGDILEKMEVYWPSYTSPNEEFWNHEYNKHGYCFTKRHDKPDEQAFFKSTIAIYEEYALDQLMTHSVGDMVTDDEIEFEYDELVDALHSARDDLLFVVHCLRRNHKQYLQEVHIYFDVELNPLEKYRPGRSNCDMDDSIFVPFEN